jgi:hypothetical protein
MRLRGSMLGAVVLVAAVALSLSASVAVAATQTYTGDVIRMVVDDYGRPALYAKPSTADGPSDPFVQQYFGGSAWGNVINIYDGETTSTFTSGYGSGTLVTPVSNDIVPAAGGSSVVTVVRLGTTGVQLTQRFTHLTGDRFVTKEWSFTNTSTVTFSRARLYHGGDTYFGNNDAAYGFYDASRKMVYVRNSDFTNWGLMGFYPDPSTLANHYFEGHYSTGNSYANAGTDLPDTVSATYQDAGYYLQWDRGAFAPGQTWSIKAYEVWTPAGALQMLAPGTMPASAGTVANVPFTIQNLSETTMTLTLAPSSDAGGSGNEERLREPPGGSRRRGLRHAHRERGCDRDRLHPAGRVRLHLRAQARYSGRAVDRAQEPPVRGLRGAEAAACTRYEMGPLAVRALDAQGLAPREDRRRVELLHRLAFSALRAVDAAPGARQVPRGRVPSG